MLAVNSLKTKIVGLVALIVISAVSLSSWFHYRQQKRMIEEISAKSSQALIESIVSNIRSSMKGGHSEDLGSILGRIKNHEHILELRIITSEGKILHSANREDIGKLISPHERADLGRFPDGHNYFTRYDNRYHSHSRIANSPECHGCHPSSQNTIAYLETEISLESFINYMKEDKATSFISTIIISSIIIGALFAFMVAYVDRPIRLMISSMRQVESGNFDPGDSTITSSDEMQMLSQHFTNMVHKLKSLVSTTVEHEREIARAQEKLEHHRETQMMNQRLEEHLKEIEALNVSLEERIEEVEQANFTIADLAAELEQKNTNLEAAVERLSTIYKIGLAINSTIDIDRLFNLIVKSTASALKAHIGYVILYDPASSTLNVTNLIGSGKLIAPQRSIPMSESGVSSWVIRNRQPLLIADIDEAPQFDRFSDLGYERRSLVCAPLMVKDEVIGTISVVNKIDDSRFTTDELEMLTTIAAQASISIKNATLYDEQQQNYLNTIQALVSAIEASDSYTRGHSERVTRYSVEIGHRLALTADRMQILERAAILHDIGKIGIDLSLLHKEGKLSPSDIVELQRHPGIGMRILEPIAFLSDVRTCIGQHHERFDGLGYPNRITHSDQLLESRILSVADAYDAMTTDRPYRKALSMEIAIRELQENSGTQFDPDVVSTFVSILEEGVFFHSRQSSPSSVTALRHTGTT